MAKLAQNGDTAGTLERAVRSDVATSDVAALEALLAERLAVLGQIREATPPPAAGVPPAITTDQWGLLRALASLAALDDRVQAVLARLAPPRATASHRRVRAA